MRERWEVHGRVQGVGFRAWIRREARRLGLRGTVRNRADGAVEIEAEGGETELRELQRRAGVGPPGAAVQRIEPLGPTTDELPEPFAVVR
jgi:acylphosphatase